MILARMRRRTRNGPKCCRSGSSQRTTALRPTGQFATMVHPALPILLTAALSRNPVVEAYRSEPPLSALSALPLPDLSSLPPLWRRALQMRSRTRPPTRRQAKHLWSSLDAKVTVTRTGRDGTLHATMTPPWALARRDRARGERRQGAGSVLARGIGRCSRPEPRARPRPRRGSQGKLEGTQNTSQSGGMSQ